MAKERDFLRTAHAEKVWAEMQANRIREESEVPIPAWVPERLHAVYRAEAVKHGEESAASLCRHLKALTKGALI